MALRITTDLLQGQIFFLVAGVFVGTVLKKKCKNLSLRCSRRTPRPAFLFRRALVVKKYTDTVLGNPLSELMDVVTSAKRIESWVEEFDAEKQFGFVRHLPRKGIYFHKDDVIPDVVGRQILKPQTIVSFELTESRGRFRASSVRDESPELAEIDLETYTETSYVHTWTSMPSDEPGATSSYGWLIRPSGDQLFFKERNVITEGVETLCSWDGVNEPVWVNHKIGSKTNAEGQLKFFATEIQILQPTEQRLDDVFLNADELPLDVPEPQRPSQTESKLLRDHHKGKTLLELIRRKVKV
jgi:cold shock CspA family protein